MSVGWAVFHPLSSPSVKPFRICVNISMISSYTVLKTKIFQNFCQYFQVLISSPSARNIFLGWRRRHKSNQLNRLEHRAASHESDFLLFCAAVFFDIYCNSCQNISLYRCLCKKIKLSRNFFSVSFTRSQMDFHWAEYNRFDPDSTFSSWKLERASPKSDAAGSLKILTPAQLSWAPCWRGTTPTWSTMRPSTAKR